MSTNLGSRVSKNEIRSVNDSPRGLQKELPEAGPNFVTGIGTSYRPLPRSGSGTRRIGLPTCGTDLVQMSLR